MSLLKEYLIYLNEEEEKKKSSFKDKLKLIGKVSAGAIGLALAGAAGYETAKKLRNKYKTQTPNPIPQPKVHDIKKQERKSVENKREKINKFLTDKWNNITSKKEKNPIKKKQQLVKKIEVQYNRNQEKKKNNKPKKIEVQYHKKVNTEGWWADARAKNKATNTNSGYNISLNKPKEVVQQPKKKVVQQPKKKVVQQPKKKVVL